MKRILLLGRNGQVAWELRRTLAPLGEVIALDRQSNPSVDLAKADTLLQAVRSSKPDIIVNAVAYTAVDLAEEEADLAGKINAIAPGILAEEAKKIGATLIHYSTDYVFPGDGNAPYREEDPTGPQSVYGTTKLAGEQAIVSSGASYLIFRTAWVYGARGHNFLLTMLRLMREREQLGVVDDQIGSPTWSRLIAETTAQILARQLNGEQQKGIYHLTCSGQTSWFGFASKIREMGIQLGLLDEDAALVNPIGSEDYPTPAKRPGYSVLDNHQLKEAFGLQLPDWREALALCMESLSNGRC